jgi:hypothetical protein
MPGATFQEIRDAIVDAYTPQSLEETLLFLMNERLDVITPPADFGYRVFKLVEWADMNGRDVELVRAMAKARPRKAKMQAIYKKYGMAIPVYVEQAGAAVPSAPTDATDGGLEKIVRPHLTFAEFGIWRDRMARVEGRVCLITINGNAQGTGFLVGPDAVLTNYHVMEPLLKGAKGAADFECVFDFKLLADKTKAGTHVSLHATDWNIDASPFSKPEAEGKPDQAQPTPEELDYALVRLAEPLGAKPWALNPNPEGGAPARGWVPVPEAAPAFTSPMGVMIAQHPAGWPLKLAIDTDAIDQANQHWLNGNGTRVRYATNTLGGSSGSPVFDLEWNLIALHHYGDPAFNHPAKYNQGVPIGQIRDRLRRAGKEAALGGSPD